MSRWWGFKFGYAVGIVTATVGLIDGNLLMAIGGMIFIIVGSIIKWGD